MYGHGATMGALLIDVTPFLVSDYSSVGDQLQNYSGSSNRVTFQSDRSHVDEAQGFPQNVEIDVFLTYTEGLVDHRPLGPGRGGTTQRERTPRAFRSERSRLIRQLTCT